LPSKQKFDYKGIEMKSLNLKFVFVFLLSIAMVLSISACGSSSDAAGDAASTEAPAADAAATEAPVADAAATDAPVATDAPAVSGDVVPSYVFTNTGTAEICELYLSPAATDNWGPDQLKSQTIAASATFTLTNIPAGKYDAKVVGCNGAGEQVLSLDIHN
jgi:hypothetical protein